MAVQESKSKITVGVGAVVLWDQKVLFVRGVNEAHPGSWQLPGGYVEGDETIEAAILREVREEAGLECEIVGLLGLRHRLYFESDARSVSENSTYLAFQLKPVSAYPDPKPDGIETDKALFLTADQISELSPCAKIFKELARKTLLGDRSIFSPTEITAVGGYTYIVYV